MSFPSKLMPVMAVLMMPLLVNAQQASHNKNYRNVVVGEGCASTCIDGVCEKTCKGDNTAKAAQAKPQGGSYDFKDFENLVISGFDAKIVQGQDYSVVADADSSELNKLNVTMQVGVAGVASLKISVSGDALVDGRMLITVPTLKSLRIYGDSDVSVSGFQQSELNLEVAGNGDVTVEDSIISSLTLRVEGNADANLSGAELMKAEVSLGDNANAQLNFIGGDDAVLNGVVGGRADLVYCGRPQRSLRVSDMADATQTDCS